MSANDTILSLLDQHHELTGLSLVKLSGGRLYRGTVYVHLDRLLDGEQVIQRRGEDGRLFFRRGPEEGTRRATPFALFPALALLALLAVAGCDKATTTEVNQPPAPPPPTAPQLTPSPDPPPPPPPAPAPPPPPPADEEDPPCVRPVGNSASVTHRDSGVCTAATCVADYSQSISAAILRNVFTFTGGDPPQSTSRTGTVLFPGADTYKWRNEICSSTSTDDPADLCCLETNGIVVFTVTGP